MSSPHKFLNRVSVWLARWRLVLAAALILSRGVAGAADPVFSGPQAGEKTTPFKVEELTGAGGGKERDPIAEHAGAATAVVFVHTIERSLLPLLRVVDQYGAERKERIKVEVVFLAGDRVAGEQRVRAAAGSLKLNSRVGLSPDGAEGPGNYGLNAQCMMTIVIARENKVTANFALVQPGISDAPKIIKALAAACGDDAPPSAEELTAKQMARTGAKPARMAAPAKEGFPGAVPTDEKLNGLLRRFIRPTNDDATVDQVLAEVEAHIKGNRDLTKQAMDGWIRILHFGDTYGTPHARKVGREFLERLKKQ